MLDSLSHQLDKCSQEAIIGTATALERPKIADEHSVTPPVADGICVKGIPTPQPARFDWIWHLLKICKL